MFSKKGQAAMEFLMTYGWAILIVLAAIGALAYFGVLSPSKHIPETCIFPQGLACLDFKVTPATTHLYLQNGFAQDIEVYNITAGSCDVFVLGQKVANIDHITVELVNCDNGAEGDTYKEEVVVTYSIAGSTLVKQSKGRIVARIA